MKSTNVFTQEHKIILRTLDVLDALAASCDAGTKPEQEDVDKVLDFLRWYADAHHQAKEESILFPAIRARAPAEDRPLNHMLFEHEQERHSIEDLEADLRLGRLSDFVARSNRLSSTLRTHIYKEDAVLFPAADSVLDQQQDEAIFEQLSQFETPLDRQTLDEKLHDLHKLEWKYLRR